jgi:hypothetical protein
VLDKLEVFAVDRKIPLTMSRISDFVQDQIEVGESAHQLPPMVASPGDSTAMISQRLAKRADNETGTLATSLLTNSPSPKGQVSRRPRRHSPPPPAPGVQWPWETWGSREKMIALSAASIALLAALTTTVLVAVSWTPTPSQQPNEMVAPLPVTDPLLPDHPIDEDTPPIRGGIKQDNASAAPRTTNATIRVESDPEGAAIIVEGTRTGRVTPSLVQVPENQSLLWIGVELEGYRAQERQVDAAAGAAFFTLLRAL